MSKRLHDRHIRRLDTVFQAGSESFGGITSNISEGGLFIRTNKALAPGTILSIEITLPDGDVSKVKGRVKRSIRSPILSTKNGMGIELTEKDSKYINFVRGITAESHTIPDFCIVACPDCGTKNKVKAGLKDVIPRCGKCRHPLVQRQETPSEAEYLIIACSNCKAKNKVAGEKISLGPRCGKCGTTLNSENTL